MTVEPANSKCSVPDKDSDTWMLPAGHWQQHELWDGTYTLDDLPDITEMIRVMRENERRAAEAVRE